MQYVNAAPCQLKFLHVVLDYDLNGACLFSMQWNSRRVEMLSKFWREEWSKTVSVLGEISQVIEKPLCLNFWLFTKVNFIANF